MQIKERRYSRSHLYFLPLSFLHPHERMRKLTMNYPFTSWPLRRLNWDSKWTAFFRHETAIIMWCDIIKSLPKSPTLAQKWSWNHLIALAILNFPHSGEGASPQGQLLLDQATNLSHFGCLPSQKCGVSLFQIHTSPPGRNQTWRIARKTNAWGSY